MKKAMQFNLPHDTKYYIVSYSYLSIEDGGGQTCENCNKLITHCVTVKDEAGRHFVIGHDCAETLSSLNKHDLEDTRRGIAAIARYYKELKEAAKSASDTHFPVIIHNDQEALLYHASTKDYKGEEFYYLKYQKRLKKQHLSPDVLQKHGYTKQDFLLKYPQFYPLQIFI